MLEDYLGLIYHGTTKQKLALPYDVKFKVNKRELAIQKEKRRR